MTIARRVAWACFALILAVATACEAADDVLVLDGPDVSFLRESLQRQGIPFENVSRLDPGRLAPRRILILSGREPSASATVVEAFLQNGGSVLALGGGAKWMLNAGLFDASGYYPTGTTIHQSTFDGYHRLTFGYPMAKPQENWKVGVPMLLRATDGPLLRLGPKASSALSAGGPFSLAAYQRVGQGRALLIGADPQGGNEYLTLDAPTPRRGDELKTDLLLANAIAWLRDPQSNLIPNSDFEDRADAGEDAGHWEVTVRNGGKSNWQRGSAPEGQVCLHLEGTRPNSAAGLSPYRPIVVEPGSRAVLSFRVRSTVPWACEAAFLSVATEDARRQASPQRFSLPAAKAWERQEVLLEVPAGAHYVHFTAKVEGTGVLELDEATLRQTGE